MWSVEQNIGQVEKGVFYKILAFLVMSLTKILETFKRFFPSSFNRKYLHTVACTVVFIGAAHFVCNAYLGRTLLVLFPAVQTKTMVTRSL